jgi:preprotein translocase subunit YajC
MGNIVLAAASSTKPSGYNPTELIVIVAIFAVVYLLMIRPQQRRRQRVQQQQSSVQPGARVRTTAGMYATVVAVDGDDVVLEVAPGVEVRYMKRAVMDVVSPGEEPEETTEDSYDAEGEDSGEYAEDEEDEGEDSGEYAEDEEDERPAAETDEGDHHATAQAPAESGSTAKD